MDSFPMVSPIPLLGATKVSFVLNEIINLKNHHKKLAKYLEMLKNDKNIFFMLKNAKYLKILKNDTIFFKNILYLI